MLDVVKKIAVIVTIAILYSVFSFSITDLIIANPEYSDYCQDYGKYSYPMQAVNASACNFTEPAANFTTNCTNNHGVIEYEYDLGSCPISYRCNTCSYYYNLDFEKHEEIGFYTTTILGVIAVIVGLYLNFKKEVLGWIVSGFLIGGMLSIFTGTMSYYSYMGRIMRVITIVLEIALVIWVTVKKVPEPKKEKKRIK